MVLGVNHDQRHFGFAFALVGLNQLGLNQMRFAGKMGRFFHLCIGSVKITETDRGLEFAPTLRALPPGKHGFHIHAEGSCQPAMKEGKAVAAGAAGGHYDPQHTGKHEGPLGAGHLGDLPLLVVNDAGVADQPIIAPRLKTLAEVKGKALMVHVGGDNMADSPQPLGGGGERFACGVIK